MRKIILPSEDHNKNGIFPEILKIKLTDIHIYELDTRFLNNVQSPNCLLPNTYILPENRQINDRNGYHGPH